MGMQTRRVWNKPVKRWSVSDFRHQIPGLDLVTEVAYMQPLGLWSTFRLRCLEGGVRKKAFRGRNLS